MKGSIYYIEGMHGYINGNDNKVYYFQKNDLLNCTIYQLEDGDPVDFEAQRQTEYKNDRARRIRKIGTNNAHSQDPVNPGINPSFVYDGFNADERKIIQQLKDVFYLTNGGQPFTLGKSTYRYCLIKPTNQFSLTFNLQREIIVIFSDYISFEPRSLEAATYALNQLHSKLRIDRGCQILISSDSAVEMKLANILRDTNLNSIVIPFSYQEFLNNPPKDLIINRFRKYLFDIDLFSSSTPIQNDIFFFGRRDYVFDIVNKCKNNIHSGIFGLRRSGKTSLLYAVKRLLENDNYPTIYIPCQSELANTTWQMSLYTIIHDIYHQTGIREKNVHSKQSYVDGNTAVCFEDDILLIFKEVSKPIVLLFDEIEAITFDIPSNNADWANGANYVAFWNVLRGFYLKNPNVISLVVAGTNPMINEIPVLKNGETNPMYGQLSRANQGAYLLPFSFSDTKNMVNTLGGYMGLKFDDHTCSALTTDCGGHPYLIRLLCSFIHLKLKKSKAVRPKTISLSSYKDYVKEFEDSNEANGFYLMILNILLTNYIKEFNALKEIALNGDKFISNFVDDNSLLHLLGYGLVENIDGNYKIRFSTIERYLRGQYKYERRILSIEEQKQEIQYRINSAEMSLRTLVKNTLKITQGEIQAQKIVIATMNNAHVSFSPAELSRASTLSLSELFDPSINKMYFSVLSQIITDNLNIFGTIFAGKSKQNLESVFATINKARRVPDHSYTESSVNWSYEDFIKFRESISWLEKILKEYQ